MARTAIDPTLIPALSIYRRPNLLYVSATQVQTESGLIDGNSSNTHVLFPDGQLRLANLAVQVVFVITRNAVLTGGSKQSGLRTGLSEATNTWYAIYAVKEQDATGWVLVGDTVLPLKTNYATLNSNFGTNGWVYLGLIRNGDNETVTGDILKFTQSGNCTQLYNTTTQFSGTIGQPGRGTKLAATSSALSLTYTYTAGTGTTDIPANIGLAWYQTQNSAITGNIIVREAANTFNFFLQHAGGGVGERAHIAPASVGCQISNGPGSSIAYAISFVGWTDVVLGIGPNPFF